MRIIKSTFLKLAPSDVNVKKGGAKLKSRWRGKGDTFTILIILSQKKHFPTVFPHNLTDFFHSVGKILIIKKLQTFVFVFLFKSFQLVL